MKRVFEPGASLAAYTRLTSRRTFMVGSLSSIGSLKFILICAVVFASIFIAAFALASRPEDPKHYLEGALDFIEENSLTYKDWPAWRAKVLAEAGNPQSIAETHPAIRYGLEMLGDHHSQLISPDVAMAGHREKQEGLGLTVSYLKRKVVSVTPGGLARRSGLRTDDTIETVNGKPIADLGGSRFFSALYGGSHVRLVLRRAGQARPIAIEFNHPHFYSSQIPEGMRLQGNIGYILLPGVADSQFYQEYADVVQELIREEDQTALCGWVVDLQSNTGGYLEPMVLGIGPVLGLETAGAWIDRDNVRIEWSYSPGRSWFGRPPNVHVNEPYTPKRVMPPVALLTGPYTASAGEAVLISFRGRPATRSFGEPTYGIPTTNNGMSLSDGAELIVSSWLEQDRMGRVYGYNERIQPDQFVASGSPRDQGTDSDPVLRDAVKWLSARPECARN